MMNVDTSKPTRVQVTSEARQQSIATRAHDKAEQRAFAPGFEAADGLAAEQEVEDWIEHRRSKREALACPIEVSVIPNGQDIGFSKIRNVAPHGLFIETAADLKPETHVRVRFNLLGQNTTYQLWGRVVHTANGGLGLAVDILEPNSRTALSAISGSIPLKHS